ncbi:MAG: YbaK/EbsC family protein [Planctomycetaceae bacterium]|jgi:Ala-tRNA(Pro) deacylase
MSMVHARILEWLRCEEVSFREVHHGPTLTSEQSAAARGEPLSNGGKALLLKCDAEYQLFVLRADCRLDSAAVKARLPCRKTRFATPEELGALTGGLVPGSVPPFGPPILTFPLHVDELLVANERIAFNAGSLTDSVILAMSDYLRLAQPRLVFPFSLPPVLG